MKECRKIFVSYKYSDSDVLPLGNGFKTTARDYVDHMIDYLDNDDHIYKGEQDGEDLSDLSEETIEDHLHDRIWDSSVTIVLISPQMRNLYQSEKQQWIPCEISYSLRRVTRNGRTSQPNAMIAVVLPDRNGSYNYAIERKNCVEGCTCDLWKTNTFFPILRKNMFNIDRINEHLKDCDESDAVYTGEVSYIMLVRWRDFIHNTRMYIDRAVRRMENMDNYNISVNLEN